MKIEDGQGDGKLAGVTQDHQLRVQAVQHSMEHDISHHKEEAYFANIADTANSLTTTATGGPLLVLKNLSESKHIVIHKVFVGTSADIIMRVVRNPVIGSLGNKVDHTPPNLHFASGKDAAVACYTWDEVGDGITGLTGGLVLNTCLFDKGHRVLPSNDAFILGENNVISFEFVGAGEVTFGIRFFFQINGS